MGGVPLMTYFFQASPPRVPQPLKTAPPATGQMVNHMSQVSGSNHSRWQQCSRIAPELPAGQARAQDVSRKKVSARNLWMYKALPPAATWPWPWEQPLDVAEQKTDLSLDKSLSQHSCQQRGVAT